MNDYLPYLVIGITTGSIYGIAAMGLVLTYKTSGLFNLGHGAVAAAAAYVFYALRQQHQVPWPIAAVCAVLVFGAIAGLLMERLARGLAGVPTSYKIIATVGLLVGIRSLLILLFGANAVQFRPFLPQQVAVRIGGVAVSWDNVTTLLLGAVSAVLLYLLFRRTRLGTAMRAVVDDPQLLDITGESPTRVRRSAWLIGCVFAAMSGVLFATANQQLDATLLSLLVVQAFGAAALAAFTSLPVAYAGGLAIGLLQAFTSKLLAAHPSFQGVDSNLPFIVLFVVLLVMPRRRLVEVGRQVKARAVVPILTGRARTASYALLLGAALLVPLFVGTHLPVWTNALTQVMLFFSLGLLVRTSGQISLCQVGFAAVGGAAFGHLMQNGFPWGVALLVAGLIAVPVGALVAIPAIRLSGLYLALATLGFGILLGQVFYGKSFMFGLSVATPRPNFLGLDQDKPFYYLLLTITVLAALLIIAIERSRLGRLLRGMADSPLALSTLGMNVNITRVIVFCISGFLAAISGALYASQYGSTNGDAYPYVQSIVILAVLAISGTSTITSSVLAAVLLIVVPGYIGGEKVEAFLQVIFGVLAIAAALLSQRSLSEVFASSTTPSTSRASTTADRLAALASASARPLGLRTARQAGRT